MAGRTKPHHIKRARIVVVVSLGVPATTTFAIALCQLSTPKSRLYGLVRDTLLWVSALPVALGFASISPRGPALLNALVANVTPAGLSVTDPAEVRRHWHAVFLAMSQN